MNGLMDGRTYGQTNGRTDGWMDGWNLNLPGTPNTSSEYYMECAACANDGFEKKK